MVYIFSIGFFVDNLRLLLLDLVNDAVGTQGCRGVKILFQPFRLNMQYVVGAAVPAQLELIISAATCGFPRRLQLATSCTD